VIANCVLLLVLSSALPLLSRILGLTNFNLLGSFGRAEWLDDFWPVLGYNCVFSAVTCTILSKKITRTILKEASKLIGAKLSFRRHKIQHSPINKTVHID